MTCVPGEIERLTDDRIRNRACFIRFLGHVTAKTVGLDRSRSRVTARDCAKQIVKEIEIERAKKSYLPLSDRDRTGLLMKDRGHRNWSRPN